MKIDVLDKGYVQYLHHMGTDLEVVNAARASFDKQVDELSDRDMGLVNYLVSHGHTSPFRHCAISLAVRAPLFVARQLWKYHVAVATSEEQDGWNESSRRYVTEPPQFYLPQWRRAAESKKQGSGEPLEYKEDLKNPAWWNTHLLRQTIAEGILRYEGALKDGIAPEQARLFLPAYAMYVSWHWTLGMQSVMHLLKERLNHDAQWETQQYAKALFEIVKSIWPVTTAAWVKVTNAS